MEEVKEGVSQSGVQTLKLVASYPLAPEQQGLWFLHKLAPDCGAYHLLFSLEAELPTGSDPRYNNLLDDLLHDYPILRCALPDTDQGPRQQLFDGVKPQVHLANVEGMDDAQLQEKARYDSRQPFNLSQPPLWRLHLYQRSPERWLVVAVVHHLLLDFWSLGLLLQDVSHRLGISEDPPHTLDGESYGPRAEIVSAQLAKQETEWYHYWRNQLRAIPPVQGLPLDRPRPARQSYEGRALPFQLSRRASENIKTLAREQGVTPFMAFLAIWSLSLYKLCGDEDWVISSPVAGRLARAERRQLGQFVNTLALRVCIDPQQTFAEFLQSVRGTVIGALKHQSCPFPWLVEHLAPARDPSFAPLSQIGFSWERLPLLADFEAFFLPQPPAQVHQFGELMLSPFAIPQQEGQLELQLEMGGECDGAFTGQLKYLTALFDRASIENLRDNFTHWIDQVCLQSNCPLVQLTGLDEDRAQRLLTLGRGPERRWPQVHPDFSDQTILGDIAIQVQRTPEATALLDQGGSYTYLELWQRAQSIAQALCRQGVDPGDNIGLFLTRHRDLPTSILGVWLAGAAYVPLDPDFPAERLGYIADDAKLKLLITETGLLQAPLCQNLGISHLDIQAPLDPAEQLIARPTASAYILYTSGSTGKPKGVRVGQASLRNFLLSMQGSFNWSAEQRLLAITTTAFDISLLELFLPLVSGGSLVVANSQACRDGQQLGHLIAAHRINCMQATPASWKMLLDADWQGAADFVGLCGGEALSPDLAERLQSRVSSLWNLYGPTETTIWSTATKLQPEAPIHLGQPLANTQLYVLDDQGQLSPPGALGELWLGGEGLALDYWQRPELTAERFQSLETLPQAGRLYRTGDKVRWNSQGQLEHHGRLDFQVKLRGYRIELGEIEQLIKRYDQVRDALVMVREDQPGDARLVAYLLAPTTLDTHALRTALSDQLPAYMLPSAWVILKSFPETPNRKIDRRALPTPQYEESTAEYRAPADALEIQLAGLFGELLNISRVGADDDFFALGGHSLLAVQLLTAIRKLTGVEIAIAELMQHNTVVKLAARVRDQSQEGSSNIRVTLRDARDIQPFWLFHPIGGNVFCYLELARQLNSQRPLIAFQAPGLADMDAAEVSIESMATLYINELRQCQPSGPYLLGGWCFGGTLAFEVARQLQEAGETIEGILLIDTRAPIAANVPQDADDATLLSWFARDLATPYGKSLRIEPDNLRALPPESMFSAVLDQAKAIGVLAPDADVEALERYFQVYIGNGIALRLYFPPAADIPLFLVRAKDEPEDYGPTLGWSELAAGDLKIVELPGDHNSIMYAPQAQQVAQSIDVHFPLNTLKGFAP